MKKAKKSKMVKNKMRTRSMRFRTRWREWKRRRKRRIVSRMMRMGIWRLI
jgi:hypothetical protein